VIPVGLGIRRCIGAVIALALAAGFKSSGSSFAERRRFVQRAHDDADGHRAEIGPVAATPAALRRFLPTTSGTPSTGSASSTDVRLTRTSSGRIFIRYLR
jgi:hypothetical protein